LEEVAENS